MSFDAPLPAVRSASLIALDRGRLLLTGGLTQDDRCSREAYLLNVDAGTCARVDSLPDGAPLLAGGGFAHTVTRVTVDSAGKLLVLGGCAADEKSCEMPAAALLVDADLRSAPVELDWPETCPSAVANHCALTVGAGLVAVVGGGYTCFFFGTVTSVSAAAR